MPNRPSAVLVNNAKNRILFSCLSERAGPISAAEARVEQSALGHRPKQQQALVLSRKITHCARKKNRGRRKFFLDKGLRFLTCLLPAQIFTFALHDLTEVPLRGKSRCYNGDFFSTDATAGHFGIGIRGHEADDETGCESAQRLIKLVRKTAK